MVKNKIKIEGARIIFKNFQGKGDEYNSQGNRNFGVILDDLTATKLEEDGWYVRRLRPREDDPEQYATPWLKVKVNYDRERNLVPIVVMITSRGKKTLTEEQIGQLDWTSIEKADLIISPYNYPARNGRPAGVSAYLKSIYVIVVEDELELKYADIKDIDENEEIPFD